MLSWPLIVHPKGKPEYPNMVAVAAYQEEGTVTLICGNYAKKRFELHDIKSLEFLGFVAGAPTSSVFGAGCQRVPS